ncbi:MAG TPA: hypothetical protein VNO70_19680, partial [Blastocatellia bacterium]|nr:hypothetical protein [Blastocatellia bacterium]
MQGRIPVEDDISRVRYELEAYLVGGAFHLYEDNRLLSAIEPAHSEAAVSYGKLIFSCWGEGWSRSWRVLGCEATPDVLRLHCAKQMGMARCVVELRRGRSGQDEARSRAEFAQALAALIESTLAGVRVTRAVAARDDRRHFSGVHVRLVINDRRRIVAGVGVSGDESQSDIDATLGAGIVWLDALRRKHPAINRLMIFAPRGRAVTLTTRLTATQVSGATISLYEVDEPSGEIAPVAAFDQGDLNDKLRRARWPRDKTPPADVAAIIAAITKLAPDSIEAHRRTGWTRLSIRGLEFARVSNRRPLVEFGLDEQKKRLDAGNWPELEELIQEINRKRDAGAGNHNHPAYRAQPERWLESAVCRDVTAIDPTLDPRYAYSQVPAYRGEQRSFIDLLAATREGRLVVIELKVSEDAEFP